MKEVMSIRDRVWASIVAGLASFSLTLGILRFAKELGFWGTATVVATVCALAHLATIALWAQYRHSRSS